MMKEPEKIMKKQLINGQLKYQVKWKGFDETTWEVEDNVKKYKELIEEFNYFSLTGERNEDRKQDDYKQTTSTSQPRTAVKRVAGPRPSIDLHKKDKKNEKGELKSIEVNDTQIQQQNNEISAAISTNSQNHINNNQNNHDNQQSNQIVQNQNNQSPLTSSSIMNSHKQNHKTGNIIEQKQQELTQKVTQYYANQDDKLEIIKLQVTDDNCVFKLQWKQRENGIIPLPEFYSYEQFKLQAPLFYMQFIECCILECELINSEIKFEMIGKDVKDKVGLIKNALMKKEDNQKRKLALQIMNS